MPLTAEESRLVSAIDADAIRRDLEQLVAIPSIGGSPAEVDVMRWGAERLRGLGAGTDHWRIDLDQLRQALDFPGMEVARTDAWGCVGTLPGDPSTTPALVLNGHCDVVPPGDLDSWHGSDPYTLREVDGMLWGRGTCDMKGGVAAILGAADAVQASGMSWRRPLAVHLVIGEEDGGIGSYATVRRGHLGDACVIAEPTNHAIISANAGSLTFRLRVPGLATHGSTRSQGVSAIEKFDVVHRELRRLEAERNRATDPLFAHLDLGWPLSVGTVAAGDWASTVPDRLTATGRYGVRPGETITEAIAVFEDTVSRACATDAWLAEHPVTVDWPGGMFAPAGLPPGHALLADAQETVADVVGARPRAEGGPYGSDLRHYAAVGIPTIQYGPGDARHAHAVDEQVAFDDVLDCARTYAVLIRRHCGGRR